MTRLGQFFNSSAFYAVMTIVAVGVLADSIFQFLDTQSVVPAGVRAVIWIVIATHFARLTFRSFKNTEQH